MEIWKPVVGYEGRYEVSNLGAVRAVHSTRSGSPRPLAQTTDSHGYLSVTLYKGDGLAGRKSFGVHQLVAAAFIGEKPAGLDVNHLDGLRANNSSTNLEYVTRSENIKHAVRLGLKKRFSPMRDPKTGRAMSKEAAAQFMQKGG